MITTTAEFEQETAWEMFVLSLAAPLMPLASKGVNLDLRSRGVTVYLTGVSSGGNAVEEFRNALLPLLFGAGWKVLDLFVELSLAVSGLTPRGKTWTMAEKSQKLSRHVIQLPGFSISANLSRAIALLYDNTFEMRHALVHRRIQVDPTTHALIGYLSNGTALTPLSMTEQLAFCRASQRIAQAVKESTLRPRVEADLREQLSTLQKHHTVPGLGSGAHRPPVRLAAELPSTARLDVPQLMAEAAKTFPGVAYVDLELHLADGRVLEGELESAPQAAVIVDAAALPAWLKLR